MEAAVVVLIQLLIWSVSGLICAAIANSRGRSGIAWFFIGVLAPCVGLILVLVLPDLNVQQHKDRTLARENRRLRERVKKDRMIADQRHHSVEERLGVHDVALGVDTEQTDRALPPPLPVPTPLEASLVHATADVEWHYEAGDESRGPLTLFDLKQLWRRGAINEHTLVWTDAMADWQKILELGDLKAALNA